MKNFSTWVSTIHGIRTTVKRFINRNSEHCKQINLHVGII